MSFYTCEFLFVVFARVGVVAPLCAARIGDFLVDSFTVVVNFGRFFIPFRSQLYDLQDAAQAFGSRV